MEDCPYGVNCQETHYRHLKQFRHEHLEKYTEIEDLNTIEFPPELEKEGVIYLRQLRRMRLPECDESVAEDEENNVRESMVEKLRRTEPYNVFFNAIPSLPGTQGANTIVFKDLLCPSLGKLKKWLHINATVEITWLIEQCSLEFLKEIPTTILHSNEQYRVAEDYVRTSFPNISYNFVELKDPLGGHHSKIGIHLYEDNSLRVTVSTANLSPQDWNVYNNGIWISPPCPQLPEGSFERDGESPTHFKRVLLFYLRSYRADCLQKWIRYVSNADFSLIRVFLIASIPGVNSNKTFIGSHLFSVEKVLALYCSLPKRTRDSQGASAWPILAQTSSIGNFGATPSEWLTGLFLQAVCRHKDGGISPLSRPKLKVIYPSIKNVEDAAFDPLLQGTSLHYYKDGCEKQTWFQDYLHQWKADRLGRSGVMPHLKTYCRVSPCLTKLAWFLLTTSNLSRSAWGTKDFKKEELIYTRSYEAGVLFLPQFFDEEYFGIHRFPMMFDFPLNPYNSDDYPYCS